MLLRTEIGIDAAGIETLLRREVPTHRLAAAVRKLREEGLVTLGVVATDDEGKILGYLAFSPVEVAGEERNWVVVSALVVTEELKNTALAKELLFEGLDSLNEFSYSAAVAYQQPEWFLQQGFQQAAQLHFEHEQQTLVVYPLADQQALDTAAQLTLPAVLTDLLTNP